MMNMKWYLANILFAQKQGRGNSLALCETCLVLLRASSASTAYDKAKKWAERELQSKWQKEMGFLGVTNLEELLASQLGDGTELTGSIFFKKDPWRKQGILVPPVKHLQAFLSEDNANVSGGELLEKVRGKAFVAHMKRLSKK